MWIQTEVHGLNYRNNYIQQMKLKKAEEELQQEILLRVALEKTRKATHKNSKIGFELILCGFAPILYGFTGKVG